MNILILGYENDVDFVQLSLKSNHHTTVAILGSYVSDDAYILTPHILAQYDCIIIAIKDKNHSQNLYTILCSILTNNSDNILDFYPLYRATVPATTVDKVMQNPLISEYNGIVLGISHAEVGILPQLLDGCFCNLAVSSQDIYYNMKTLEYCLAKYKSKICNLKYLIFDMFDYSYFNYDVSMSHHAGTYHNHGGFNYDPHNFDDNKFFSCNFYDMLNTFSANRYINITTTQLELWDKLFENVHIHNNFYEFNNFVDVHLRIRTVMDKDIEEYNANTSIVRKIFHKTIHENIQYFYQLLHIAYGINPDLKIFCILIPRYYKAQEKSMEAYAPWKEMFYTIIRESQKVYPYTFLDFTNDEISRNSICYYDPSHLNYYGAIKFTQHLNTFLTDK